MEQNIKIAVIGGTGKAGKFLVKQLLDKDYYIRLLLRNPDKFQLSNHLVEIVKGDARDYSSIQALLEGCNVVISTLGQPKGESPIFSQATRNIIAAMKVLKIQRYILVTGLGLNTPYDKKSFRTRLLSKFLKLSFPAIIADIQKEYKVLTESNIDRTLARLPWIEQSASVGNIKVSLEDSPGKKISTSDLANFLISQLSESKYIKQAPFIAN